jgi:hypothetical protein
MDASAIAFPSGRDAWLVAVLWISAAVLVFAALVMAQVPGSGMLRGLVVAVCLASGALVLWVIYGTGYTVGTRAVDVRSGPFRWAIPLEAIVSVAPSNDMLASPAASLDRLRVDYRTRDGRSRAMLLSPADKDGFLAALAARCPQLERAGDRLVPRS